MDLVILTFIALAPPIAFLLYIHHLDKVEPEPFNLIIKTLALGGLAVIPAAGLEWLMKFIPMLWMGEVMARIFYAAGIIAPIEEALKLGVVLLFIWKNRNFNEENDGIVYVGTAAIGFAMAENLLYVLQLGYGNGILRALTSIPLHTFTGVIMGYFVGIARFSPTAKDRAKKIVSGFVIAWLIHGIYDGLVFSGTGAALLIIPLVVALFVLGFIYLKKGAVLSAKRWGSQKTDTNAPQAGPPAHPSPASGTYKIIISRILIGMCAIFWAMLIIGILQNSNNEGSAYQIVVGGVVLTFIPVIIGIILEISYRRHHKAAAAGM